MRLSSSETKSGSPNLEITSSQVSTFGFTNATDSCVTLRREPSTNTWGIGSMTQPEVRPAKTTISKNLTASPQPKSASEECFCHQKLTPGYTSHLPSQG